MKHYDEASCVRAVNSRPGASVSGKFIEVTKDNHAVGIRTWGKIDFLCKYCGYHYMITNRTVNNSSRKRYDDSDDNLNRNAKRNTNKFSLSKLVKDSMR